jgi:gamma-glutamylcyclotransferase (GGCT)/AIG2-like uncharacterized protein YtfP
VGDWDGDGDDSLAVRRGSTYYLKNDLSAGAADRTVVYGRADDTAFIGDWNGDRQDTIGIRRPPPPVFAYGTLRRGQVGYPLLDGTTTREVLTRMPLLDMYRLSGSTYPFAVPNRSNPTGIVGEAMHLRPDSYSGTLARLDRFERYDPGQPPENQSYVREVRATREGVMAWVYVAGPRMAQYLRDDGVLISSGDFLRW